MKFVRYPLVYLVEAADDICYQVMDIEDAHKLRLLTTEKAIELFLGFFEGESRERCMRILSYVTDVNEQIAYLRSAVIGLLVGECSALFLANEGQILAGEFSGTLIGNVSPVIAKAYGRCAEFALQYIYRSKDVLDIELAGYRIIGYLLDVFTDAIRNPQHAYSKLLLDRIPEQYETDSTTLYGKTQSVIDYISGMTDVYALDLYRKITGMGLPVV